MSAPGGVADAEQPAVTVPATSANLGPGFDAFGLALDVTLRARAIPRQEHRVVSTGEGAGELATDDGNLVWRALVAYCDWAGAAVPDVSLAVGNDIPLERGMGSSAAAAVAGVALGRVLTRAGGGDQDLIDLAAQLEGHPDNAAPAVLGGLVVCIDGRARRLEPSERLRPVLCVPGERAATEMARGLIPETVSVADAAANGARAAVVLAGLAGALAWDPAAMRDVLHEPARLEAMAPSGRLVAALRAAGIGACLSGAGPSVLAIVPSADADAARRVAELAGPEWSVRPSAWNRTGVAATPPTVVAAPR